ncbi:MULTISPECIES: phosphotransferase-like protein [Streptomyces]|uniref:phosphotransferase-like protein n=1 Tax=Streptomyces TaxID=1883 RepID=UPI000E06F068|nr:MULTISPECIES: guanylate kinase [Streptomyces]MBT3077384.1 guanylate kinase [Streptomyces sp. COG21]MBT3082704.1 guanylate kinase [Streptomyces sp. COG20]MBT3087525.1 guanylate kinase [Streptomyces sp. CYG21]MBT3097443.1 guanylate kinase [Streptomyces sp. CBG30]MBT3104677.1 guanylate kinase [Streptomyces sp. COG19]
MRQGILLYGPPAAGKDTITAALTEIDERYALFTRLKIGTGKTQGYRMGTPEQLTALDARGDVIYRNDRYGNIYVVDRPGLDQAMEGGSIPVVHLGQIAGMEQVTALFPARWVRVLLWCSKETTARRSPQRGDTDTAARLAAWDATQADLAAHPRAQWELRVETDATASHETAQRIDDIVRTTPPRS